VQVRGLFSFPSGLKSLMREFGKWNVVRGLRWCSGGGVLAIDGPDVKVDGIGQRAVRLCFGFSCTLARLVRLSPLGSQSMLIRVDGGFEPWRQTFLSDSVC